MIEFDRGSKVYPDGTTAVREFSLEIPSHAMIALVGSSGSAMVAAAIVGVMASNARACGANASKLDPVPSR